MRFYFLFFYSMSIFTMSHGQTIRILDAASKTPLRGVQILGPELQLFATTDSTGHAEISNFKDLKTIHFIAKGYQTKTQDWKKLETNLFILEMLIATIQMPQAIVSASKWSQSSQDIPRKVSVLSASDLQIRNPSNTSDWLGSSGEVFIQKSQQGGGSPMIRGFAANRLLYAVDGVRMNTAIFRSGNLQNVISIDPFAIQNTEILFGPGSVLYGSDAIGGVMSFETLKPSFAGDSTEINGTIATRLGTANDEISIHGHISMGLKKWAFLTSFSHFNYEDLKMGTNGPNEYLRPSFVQSNHQKDSILQHSKPQIQVPSAYSQWNIMQKIRFKSGEKSELDYAFHYSKSSDIPRYDRLIEKTNSGLKFASWYYGPQIWMMNSLGFGSRKNTPIYDQMKLKIAHQYFEESRNDRRFNDRNLFQRVEKVQALSINADFIKSNRAESFLTYGGEWVFNDVQSMGQVQNIQTQQVKLASARYPDSNWNSFALYGTHHAHFSDQLKLQSGIRYNFIQINADFSNNLAFYPLPFAETSNSYGSITGSLGVIYNPVPSLTISPVFSTGFRAPNVDDLGKIFDSEPGTVLVPNPMLRPEYAYNSELNILWSIGKSWQLDFSGFYTLLDQALVRRPFTLNGLSEIEYEGEVSQVLAIQNAAKGKVYGFQAGLVWTISPEFSLKSQYNWQRGNEELDDTSISPSRHAAPIFGLTRLSYSKQNLRFELTSQYSGRVDQDRMPLEEIGKPHLYLLDKNGRPFSPNWLIFNLQGLYQIDQHVQIGVGIENLGNTRYRPFGSGIAAPGRNFTFSVVGNL